ncbi:serine hydrolase domain-containing protein [Metabacillus endolithicus]|uniref:Serine hydrolase domain-containing protein n=1 Tax=Metabacillus endolithicus TaxID=1535204 RepID=A0ABW5BUT0_9BACI|nr:serine hydrolase domain-containing protein [Metabacillus endolithicus]UPG63461.1 beta-lactamase family protein [Metabacillus endolithicus]
MNTFQSYMERRPKFSGVISISKGNEIIYEDAFGLSNKEKEIENNIHTKYPVGSMLSKPLTAVATFQLIEKGKLSLHQPIDKFLPFYKNKGITIHHLLNHTSGIPNLLMLRKQLKWDQDYTQKQIFDTLQEHKLNFTPGQKISYNNTGFFMLGLIIEKVSGVTYHDYIKENIFKPANMKHTGFLHEEIEGTANNYINQKSGPYVSPTLLFACGDAISTLEDIHLFHKALESNILITKISSEQMQTPTYKGRFITMGYSWFIKQLFGRKSVSHGGTHPGGFTTHVERYLDDDMTIVVISNDMISHKMLTMKELGATLISRELASLLFNQKLHHWQKFF